MMLSYWAQRASVEEPLEVLEDAGSGGAYTP